METIVLKSNSKDDLILLMKLARKLGIEVSVLSEEIAEEISFIHAIKKGRTWKLVDTNKMLQTLKR
ncbi:MAG: hypothetical protein ABIQ02_02375 [Saprospiraceae bacterium]